MRRRAFLLMMFCAAPALFGAHPQTAMRGRVTSGGAPVANATITAVSRALQQPRTTVTSANGPYWLEALPPGEYEVTFASPGLQTLTRRVIVELGRVARADASLEPSEDEESVTSTATTIAVADTIPITTHRTAEMLERFPVYPDIFGVAYASPGFNMFGVDVLADGSVLPLGDLPGESLDESVFIRGAHPLDAADVEGHALHVLTRSGGEDFSLSVRDTYYEGGHLFESASGGRIVPERLWFFASGAAGDRRDAAAEDIHAIALKLTAQLSAAQNLSASYRDAGYDFFGTTEVESAAAALRHVAQWGARLTTEAFASRGSSFFENFPRPFERDGDRLSAKATWVAAAHVLSGGVSAEDGDFADYTSLFVSDRWRGDRWTLLFGAQYTNGSLASDFGGQAAATYDLRGDGTRAFVATASRYVSPDLNPVNELTVGYAAAIGSSGMFRADYIRRDYSEFVADDSLQLEGHYRLFDRFGIGGSYSVVYDSRGYRDFGNDLDHEASALINAELSSFSATVVQRYENRFGNSTDAGARYTFPLRRARITLGVDVNYLIARDPVERFTRFWARVRI